MNKYDIVIIGSGIGGLVCGGILAREGYRVCILEKNNQIGGSLQTFSRDKRIFDSGVHYLGGLGEGQNLYQIFKYLEVMDKLKLERMDEDAFDKILIGDDPKEYRQGQGYENFIRNLVKDFPEEEAGIRAYCEKIKEVCSRFPLYNLRTNGLHEDKADVWGLDTYTVVSSLIQNKILQSVLVGNNALYVGRANETPFYIHSLIINSYIQSAWKCVNGGSQIANILAKNIRKYGGEIIKYCEVTRLVTEAGKVLYAETANGKQYHADRFISNLHPARTMDMTESEAIKPVYRKRIASLPQTISSFLIHIALKENCFPYYKHNYYYHKPGHIWGLADYTEDNWPLGYAIFLPPSYRTGEYADAMTIFSYMRYEEMKPWEHTFNTIYDENDRGADYELFKKRKAETLLDCVEQRFPGLRNCIKSYSTSTPLSYRDYIGNYDGSLYGVAKDYRDPLKTFISPRTKVRNLYLTGQNINVHGVLGASISALLTCITILGNEDIVEKIKNA